MPAKPISFGSLHFAKKGDAELYLMEMLNRYDIGDKVSPDDAVVLKAVLAAHPEGEAKAGSGIFDFSVRSGGFGTKCFWVNRTDGTTEDFSFRKSIY